MTISEAYKILSRLERFEFHDEFGGVQVHWRDGFRIVAEGEFNTEQGDAWVSLPGCEMCGPRVAQLRVCGVLMLTEKVAATMCD